MPSTEQWRRDIFRTTAQLQHVEWPAYESTPFYDRSSVTALRSDIRTVTKVCFDHDSYRSTEEFFLTTR